MKSLLLEFSSSIMCLILAGKVGSNIASEIGTMRVTQQIDALEIMGSKLCLLSDSSKDSGIDDHDSFSGDFQYFCRSDRCFLYSLVCWYHECDGFGIWFTVLLCGMVYLV